MGAYVGINSTPAGGYTPVARKIKKIYVGDENGIARLVKKAYVGVDGVAKLFWNSAQEEQEPVFLDYIESTGTQYIDTGFKPNSNTSIEMKVLIPSSQAGKFTRFFEARNDEFEVKESFGVLNFNDSNNVLQIRYDTGKNSVNDPLAVETEYTVKMEKNKLYVDDVLRITQTPSTFQVNYNLLLFGFHTINTIHTQGGIYRLYHFKIYDNGTLIRDFKPYKDANGVICLYDLVEGKCYYNQGTGTFISGEEINTDQLVNYLMLYDGSLGEAGENGANVCADVTGGFSKMVSSGSATLTYNANNVYFANVGTGTNSTAFMTNNSIDMTEYSLLCGKSLPNTSNYISSALGVRNKKGYGGAGESGNVGISSNTNNSGVVSDGANSNFIGKLFMYDSNISSITNGYPYFADYSSGTASMTIYSMFLVKQDNWQELCSIAGLNSSDYASEETLCANNTAITQILSNASAVDFMLKQCTGTFMYYFVRSSTCLTALNNSTNKTKIHANEHWSKFLNMVA